MSWRRHLTPTKLLRFALVGAGATALQYLIAALLHWGLGWRAAVASGTGFAVSALANYLANARYTFETHAGHAKAFPRFVLVAASGLVINSGIVELGQRMLVSIVLAQLFATAVVLLWNFAINAVWSFRVNADGGAANQ